MTSMPMEGLKLEQAPPLAIPMAFFLTAPLAIAAAGALLGWEGVVATSSMWMPATVGLTHLGTLGLLAMVMWGALYQMIPVLAGTPVPAIRLARLVHALLALGVGALAYGLAHRIGWLLWSALGLLSAAFVLFVVPVGLALGRSRASTPTTQGMRLALASLVVVVVLGLLMALGHAGLPFPGLRTLWMQVHLSVALLGWVGALLAAVSWQVVPMFYLTEEPTRRSRTLSLVAIALGITLPVAVLLTQRFELAHLDAKLASRLAALGALPAALAVWLVHPVATLVAISRRRRKRADPSLLFWRAGLVLGVVSLVVAGAAHLLDDPLWPLLFGWLAIWGWAGTIVHGMLARIVPFLAWFHRFSPLIGQVPVPSVRKILPDRYPQVALGLHMASLAGGVVAILTTHDLAARLTGGLLVATGIALAVGMVHALRQSPPPLPLPRPAIDGAVLDEAAPRA